MTGLVAVIYPPSETQRDENERTDGRSEALAAHLRQLFGRWPSIN